jgi:urease accessory protein
MTASIVRRVALAGLFIVASAASASAHHPMGGEVPATFVQGLLSGFGHPVIGLDHFAAIVGVGLLAGVARRGVITVTAFSAAVILGVVVHLGGVGLPGGELLVGLTTLLIGVLVIVRPGMPPALVAVLFAVAGFVHGHALGESVVGAEPTPIAAYLIGLFFVQTAIGAATCQVAPRLFARQKPGFGLSMAGGMVALVGGIAATMTGLAA